MGSIASPSSSSPTSSVDGKVILVAGAACPIGLAATKMLLKDGAKLSICDTDEKGLDEIKTWFYGALRCPDKDYYMMKTVVDVSKATEVDAWIKKTVKTYGRIDGAANLAGTIGGVGLWPTGPLADLRDKTWDLVIAKNLTALMYCLHAELAEIRKGGSIVCVAALLGQTGIGLEAAYSVCKVSGQAREKKVVDSRNMPIESAAQPEKIARVVVLFLSENSSCVTGTSLGVDRETFR